MSTYLAVPRHTLNQPGLSQFGAAPLGEFRVVKAWGIAGTIALPAVASVAGALIGYLAFPKARGLAASVLGFAALSIAERYVQYRASEES